MQNHLLGVWSDMHAALCMPCRDLALCTPTVTIMATSSSLICKPTAHGACMRQPTMRWASRRRRLVHTMPIWDSQARCPERVQALKACACMETALQAMDDAVHCIHRMHGCPGVACCVGGRPDVILDAASHPPCEVCCEASKLSSSSACSSP